MKRIAAPTNLDETPEQSQWADRVTLVVNAVSESGGTAARPTRDLYVGQMYFDIMLGKPVWWRGSLWADAAGVPS